MFKADTSSNTTRRALALGAGAFASVGLTAGAAATVADAALPSPHPDAELISLCAKFDTLERGYQAVCGRAQTTEQERLDEPLLDALRSQQELLLERICAIPSTTPEGHAALAVSLLLWDGELYVKTDDANARTNERLLAALVRSLLAGRA
jgi:hypothetical protein